MSVARPKIKKLLQAIAEQLDRGTYLDTRHAFDRRNERRITRSEVLFVLRNGFHESRKDVFNIQHKTWNYAIRGKTIDGRNLRVIVSFDREGMLVITAIDLDVK